LISTVPAAPAAADAGADAEAAALAAAAEGEAEAAVLAAAAEGLGLAPPEQAAIVSIATAIRAGSRTVGMDRSSWAADPRMDIRVAHRRVPSTIRAARGDRFRTLAAGALSFADE
jgi:hypothetical protein